MNRVTLLLFCVVLFGVGCTSLNTSTADEETSSTTSSETDGVNEEAEEVMVSDFTPPIGAVTGPNDHGPWGNRLVFATSTDGQAFTSTGEVLSDQADVPDLTMDADGRLYLYYVAWTAGERNNQLAVAISDDQGDSWVFKFVDVEGMKRAERGPSPVDPDIQILSDGTFRLYFTYAGETHYAESEDGIVFIYKGTSFKQSNHVLDPNTILTGDIWHLFAGGGPGGNWHATSTDGRTFEFLSIDPFESTDGLSYMMANGIPVEDGYRYWGFSNQGKDIHSFFSADGYLWASEGVSLAYSSSSDVEEVHVKDPSVIQLSDGTFLMVYVTEIP